MVPLLLPVALLALPAALLPGDDIEEWARRLKSPDAAVRRQAASNLARVGSTRSFEALIPAVKDQDPGVRQWALVGLGRSTDPRLLELLIGALADASPGVRRAAALDLSRIVDVRAVGPLVAALGDEDAGVRVVAEGALTAQGPAAVDALVAAVEGLETPARGRAAGVLAEIEDPRAAAALAAALKAKHLDVVAAAHVFLIARGESGSEAVLAEALERGGDIRMAQDLLDSGNRRLQKAARRWASRARTALDPPREGAVKWRSAQP